MSGTFRLDIKHSIDDFVRRIDFHERDNVPFVTAYALTKTAQDIKAAEVEVMAAVFDRPTRFTLNSLFVDPATKRRLTAHVRFKEGFGAVPAWRYLGPQIEGGGRAKKSHERALERAGILRAGEYVVPGRGVALDAHGNMRGGDITRILSALQANPDPLSKTTQRSKRRRRGRNLDYFVLRGAPGARDGVYLRKSARQIVPVMIFVRAPAYAKRFPFYETARRVMQQRFAVNFREGWQRYVVSAPRRRAA
ncbi:MAG TPA: hypothetical protein VIH40_04585 [Xanthobacteraceae bacterium]